MDDHVFPASFSFQVSLHGEADTTKTVFQEADGLGGTMDTTSIAEGGQNRFEHRLPKPAKFGNLILRRGLLPTKSLLVEWCRNTFEAALDTQTEIREMTVSLLDHTGLPVAQWTFTGVYPVNWQVASLGAEDNQLVVEAIELAYAGLTRIQ